MKTFILHNGNTAVEMDKYYLVKQTDELIVFICKCYYFIPQQIFVRPARP